MMMKIVKWITLSLVAFVAILLDGQLPESPAATAAGDSGLSAVGPIG
jgi:hypothetical protein